MAEPGRFAVDSAVPPARVVSRHPQPDRRSGRRPSAAAGDGPAAPDQVAVPPQHGLGGDEQPWPAATRNEPAQRGLHRSVAQDGRGRATCRRSTASWWRRMRISASFDAQLRVSRPSQPIAVRKIRYRSRRATNPRSCPTVPTSERAGQTARMRLSAPTPDLPGTRHRTPWPGVRRRWWCPPGR